MQIRSSGIFTLVEFALKRYIAVFLLMCVAAMINHADAGEKSPSKLELSLRKRAQQIFDECARKHKQNYAKGESKKWAEELARGMVSRLSAAEQAAYTDAEIKNIVDALAKSIKPALDAEFSEDAAKDRAEEKKQAEEQKKAKPKTPPRWVWREKDWKKLKSLEKKIKAVKGYTSKQASGQNTVDKVWFEDRTFYKYETAEFAVWSDLNPRFTAELTLYTEKFVKYFPKIFPVKPRGKVISKLVIVVFYDRSQYKKVVPAPINSWSRGVFSPIEPGRGWPEFTVYSYFYDGGTTDYDGDPYEYDENWNPVRKKKSDRTDRKGAEAGVTQPNFSNFPYVIVQHEATHAMLRKYVGLSSYVYRKGEWEDMLPIFLDEGCATLFQNFDLYLTEKENLKRTAFLCNDRWMVRRELEKSPEKQYDLPTLLEMVNGGGKPGTWAPDDGGEKTAMNYATAQTFAHYLLCRRSGRKLFKKMFAQIYRFRPVLEEKECRKVSKGWNKHIREVILAAEAEEGSEVSIHELKVKR